MNQFHINANKLTLLGNQTQLHLLPLVISFSFWLVLSIFVPLCLFIVCVKQLWSIRLQNILNQHNFSVSRSIKTAISNIDLTSFCSISYSNIKLIQMHFFVCLFLNLKLVNTLKYYYYYYYWPLWAISPVTLVMDGRTDGLGGWKVMLNLSTDRCTNLSQSWTYCRWN